MKRGLAQHDRKRCGILLVTGFCLLWLASSLQAQQTPASEFTAPPSPDVRVFANSPFSTAGAFQTADGTVINAQATPAWTSFSAGSGPFVVRTLNNPYSFGVSSPTELPGGLGLRETVGEEFFPARLSPVLAARLGDIFEVGASVDVLSTDMAVRRSDNDRRIRTDFDPMALQGNVGIAVRLTDSQSLGLSYRSTLDIDSVEEVPNQAVAPAPGSGIFRTESRTRTKFPTVLSAGYGIDLSGNLRLATDLSWLQFSKNKDLPLMAASGLPAFPGSVNENWRDTFAISVAASWRVGAHWTARAGYQFYRSPVPNETFASTIAGQNFLTLGLGYSLRNQSLEVAYGTDFYDARRYGSAIGTAAETSSNWTVHLVSVSYRLVF